IVGECNDGFLNDIRGLHVTPEHARQAIQQASAEVVQEGSVGAGTGMSCLGYKGGVGTSSRVVLYEGKNYTVGALVVSNFGKAVDLALNGWGHPLEVAKVAKPEGQRGKTVDGSAKDAGQHADDAANAVQTKEKVPDGSVMMVLATDAPLNERQLKRLAKRAVFGLARIGSYAAHGSGDIVIAFSTAQQLSHYPANSFIQLERVH
ncbi:P1 family peptidase, partial [Frankia sp. Cpl3]|nr:P1 family peptidase [Frankia sp. Cpl3]